MKIVYLGTPDFSVLPLKTIVENTNHQVVAVVCNKDKPFGRKKVITPPPVKVFALEKGIPVYQYDKIRTEGVDDLKSLNADMFITCAFGQILSKEILDIQEVPQRLCVIGGGVIGLEFASIFKSFGSEVTVLEYFKEIALKNKEIASITPYANGYFDG